MDGIKEAAEAYPIYDKSTYSSFQVPAIRQAARKADRIILTGVVSECCVLSTFFEGIDLGCKLIWLTDATSGLNPILEAETCILQGIVTAPRRVHDNRRVPDINNPDSDLGKHKLFSCNHREQHVVKFSITFLPSSC